MQSRALASRGWVRVSWGSYLDRIWRFSVTKEEHGDFHKTLYIVLLKTKTLLCRHLQKPVTEWRRGWRTILQRYHEEAEPWVCSCTHVALLVSL